MDKKLSISLDKLCIDLPDEFKQLLMYSRTLEFEEKPDYNYLKGLFKENGVNLKIDRHEGSLTKYPKRRDALCLRAFPSNDT